LEQTAQGGSGVHPWRYLKDEGMWCLEVWFSSGLAALGG